MIRVMIYIYIYIYIYVFYSELYIPQSAYDIV